MAQPIFEAPGEPAPSFSGVEGELGGAAPPAAPPAMSGMPTMPNVPAPQPTPPPVPQPPPAPVLPQTPQLQPQPQPQQPVPQPQQPPSQEFPQAPPPLYPQQPGQPVQQDPLAPVAPGPPLPPGEAGQPPVPGQPAPPAPADQQIDLLAHLQEKGMDLGRFGENPDPKQVFDQLIDDAQMAGQYRLMDPQGTFSRLGQEVARDPQAWIQQYQQQQAAGQPPQAGAPPQAPAAVTPAPAEQPPPWPAPPELGIVDRQILQGLNAGTIEPKDVPVEIRGRLEARTNWERGRSEALLTDPGAAVLPLIQPKLDERYVSRDQVEQMFQQQRNEDYNRHVAASQERAWYVHGPDGGPVFNPETGRPRLTEYGQKWAEAEQVLSSVDMTNPAHVTELIGRLVGPPPTAGPNGQAAPPQAPQPPQVQTPQPQQPVPQPVPQPTPQQAFVDQATALHAQYPGYPPADRTGAVGQPQTTLGPADLAPPRFSDVERELHGQPAQW